MSEQPQSSDGLVMPEAFPVQSSSMNVETVNTAASNLRSMGNTVDTHMDNIVSYWGGLPGVYVAPGAEQVYAMMGPAATSAESLKNTLDKAAKAIETYAEALGPIKTKLQNLEKEAKAFRKVALAGYDGKTWREHQPAVDRNVELLGQYADIVEALTTASSTCANAINGLFTQTCPAPFEVISADAIMQSGEMMPWGAPVEKDRNCGESVVHGAGNFLKSTWDGAKALAGFGEDGWSLDNLGKTWLGVADFVGSTVLLASPVLSETIKFFGNDSVDSWVDQRHDVAKTALTSFVGYDYMAAKEGGDGWHKWKKDGVAALTESVLNIGTCFIPGAGAGGAASKVGLAGAKVAVTGTKVAGIGSKVVALGSKVVKVSVKVADFAIPGGGHLVNGLGKVINVSADAVRAVDDVPPVRPKPGTGGVSASTRVTNTFGLGGGNSVVSEGADLAQKGRVPKVPASPVGDVADLADGAGRKAPRTDSVPDVSVDDARGSASGQRPATPSGDVPDSSRVPESRAPEGSGSKVSDVEASRAPESAGSRTPDADGSRVPDAERVRTLDVDSSRAPDVDSARSPETSGSKVSDVEASRSPEVGAGKSSDLPEAERVPQEADSRVVDDAVEVDAGRSPDATDAGDGVDAPEGRDGSAESGREGSGRNDGAEGASERPSVKDPSQWPGEELAPGAERRPVPKGDRDWWYDEDGYPHEKGDPNPETTFRGEGGRLHEKGSGDYVTDPNPADPVDAPDTVKAKYGEYGPDDNIESITKKAEGDPTFEQSVEHRQTKHNEHQADVDRLNELGEKHNITTDEMKKLKGENRAKELQHLVAKKRLNDLEMQELKDALLDEKQSMKELKNASEVMGEAGVEGVMKVREEISLFGSQSKPGAGHLDKIGVRLDPPRISVYEAKGGTGSLGTSKVEGIPHQQGTGGYLQKLLEQDPRVAQALSDLIDRLGPDADALRQAIAKGDVEINYELVRAQPSGRIKMSKFLLDEKPTLPDGIIKK